MSAAAKGIVPDAPIRARVAAKLYSRPPQPRPAPPRPAGSIMRGRFTKTSAFIETPTPITIGQVVRAGLVLGVVLMLAPTPQLGAQRDAAVPSVAQAK